MDKFHCHLEGQTTERNNAIHLNSLIHYYIQTVIIHIYHSDWYRKFEMYMHVYNVMNEVRGYAHRQGIWLHLYLDDWLLRSLDEIPLTKGTISFGFNQNVIWNQITLIQRWVLLIYVYIYIYIYISWNIKYDTKVAWNA